MKEGLQQLLKLQDVDKELQALEDAKKQYPAEIDSRQREVELAQQNLEAQEKNLEELSRKQRHLELDLEAGKADLKEHEARFAAVTTNKEYDALQHEIEVCKTRIAECETHILEVIETIETLVPQLETERQTFAEVSQVRQKRIGELQEKLDSIQQEIDSIYAHRQGFTQGIDANLLRVYERSRRRLGTRVSAIRKGACGSCFRELPAQQRSNVRRNQQLYYCENCGVILVWDDQSN